MTHERVVIIGSGPAGLTAALYAARADLDPRVFEGSAAGGQLMITTDVENYPGFPDGIMGPELMDQFRKQAERFGARLQQIDVTEVDFSQRPFKIATGADQYTADAVIVATGATAKWLGNSRRGETDGPGCVPPAPPVTGSSSGIKNWSWWGVAIPPWKRHSS